MAPQSGPSIHRVQQGTGLGVHDNIRGTPKCSSFFQNENKQWSFRSEIASILSLHQHSHRRCFLVFLVGEALTECPGRGGGVGSRLEHHPHRPREDRVRQGQ